MNGHLYSQVVDYLDDLNNHDESLEEDDRFNFNVLCALHNNDPVQHMHVEGLNNLIQGIFSHFENQTPGKAAISQFVKRWLENPGKRDEILATGNKSSSLGANNSGDDAGSFTVAPQRGYKHTYATLDQEIAVALLPISPTAPVLSGNLRDAEKLLPMIERILNGGRHNCAPLRRYSNTIAPVSSVLYRMHQRRIPTIFLRACAAILFHGWRQTAALKKARPAKQKLQTSS